MRVIVWHGGYGCDTGCCGHWVEMTDGEKMDEKGRQRMSFDHPSAAEDDPLAFAKRLVTETFGAEHVADLDWDECEIVSYADCPFS